MLPTGIAILMISVFTYLTTNIPITPVPEAKFTPWSLEHKSNAYPGFEKKGSSKPIILLVIDSLMDKPLQEVLQKGQAPAFDYFIRNGTYLPNLVSSYPTMSVTIDSSLLTGTYANKHQIPGLVWFNMREKRYVNYGNGKREILKLGVGQVLKDSLIHLNQTHLSSKVATIHEELSAQGKTSASINVLVYRGTSDHTLTLPKIIQPITPLKEPISVQGPKHLSLGNLKHIDPYNPFTIIGYGINDRFSFQELKHLIKTNQVPDFTIVYLPDHDHFVHRYGPQETSGIIELDKKLQRLLQLFPAWEEAINNYIWVVIGDSGQTAIINNRNSAVIDLKKLLTPYRIAKIDKNIRNNTPIVLAVNERMAYIYTFDPKVLLSDLIALLEKDERVDVIAWKNERDIIVKRVGIQGELRYRPEGDILDIYNQSWTIEGNLEVLDLKLVANGKLTYGDYPDALARIYGAHYSHQGNFLTVDAKPGYEFAGEGSPVHIGGAGHGSLHKQDSLAPLIIAGTSSTPPYPRMVDLKQWLLDMLE